MLAMHFWMVVFIHLLVTTTQTSLMTPGPLIYATLHKTLYGLNYVPQAWYNEFKDFVISFGFTNCKFLHNFSGITIYFLVHVNDFIVMGNSDTVIWEFIQALAFKFSNNDLSDHFFLGIEVVPSSQKLS